MPHLRKDHPHGPEIIFSSELEKPIKEAATDIEKIAKRLIENGRVTISGNTISPAESCLLVVAYERKPKGEYCLKIELEWITGTEDSRGAQSTSLTID